MPLIPHSNYKPPLLLRNRHLMTVFPTLFRKIARPAYKRTRIATGDNDFVDLDFSGKGNDRIVLILHGLEGSSYSKSVAGMVAIFNRNNYDTVSMNFRGCSGEPNLLPRFYHIGETEDLDTVIRYLASLNKYRSIHIVAFSLGGNVSLKYAGEKGAEIKGLISSIVAISVPCDVRDSTMEMEKRHNSIYMKRFIRELEEKLLIKAREHPGIISMEEYKGVKTIREFDHRYTTPIHGFKDAEDYWKSSGSRQYLGNIQIPALLINAIDDPFLGKNCFPYEEAQSSDCFYLETPHYGGHVGFVAPGGAYWSEQRALWFVQKYDSGQ